MKRSRVKVQPPAMERVARAFAAVARYVHDRGRRYERAYLESRWRPVDEAPTLFYALQEQGGRVIRAHDIMLNRQEIDAVQKNGGSFLRRAVRRREVGIAAWREGGRAPGYWSPP